MLLNIYKLLIYLLYNSNTIFFFFFLASVVTSSSNLNQSSYELGTNSLGRPLYPRTQYNIHRTTPAHDHQAGMSCMICKILYLLSHKHKLDNIKGIVKV